jgi:hypothetical protein
VVDRLGPVARAIFDGQRAGCSLRAIAEGLDRPDAEIKRVNARLRAALLAECPGAAGVFRAGGKKPGIWPHRRRARPSPEGIGTISFVSWGAAAFQVLFVGYAVDEAPGGVPACFRAVCVGPARLATWGD